MRRTLYSCLLAASLLAGGLLPERAAAMQMPVGPEQSVSIWLDGYRLPVQPEPIVYKSRTMVPFRALANALGIEVQWDEATRTIRAAGDEVKLELRIGEQTAMVNDKPVALDAEPVVLNDRTLVPLRFFSEAIGAKVGWDEEAQQVLITSQPRKMHTMVFYGLGSYGKRQYLPKFDEAAFTWSRLDGEGRLTFDSSEYRWPLAGAESLLSAVRSVQMGTSLMVFSVNEHGEITRLMEQEELADAFARELAAKLKEQKLDGAVLDLESIGDPVKDDVLRVREKYAAFVKRVADVLHKEGKTLQVVVAVPNGWYQGYDYKKLAQSADRLFLMAYSYIEDKKPQPLDKIDEAIRLTLEQVPANKVMLGINAYSENEATVREKVGLAKRYGLHGVGFWILAVFDDPLMKAVGESLKLQARTLPKLPD
jgi:hypothetical protein